MTARVIPLAALALLSACTMLQQPPAMVAQWTAAWRDVAKPADRERLRNWRGTFVSALAAARQSGHAADITREGALLDPDAALARPAIPNGAYRCRVIKIGAKSEGLLQYVSYAPFTCTVAAERELQRLTKVSGSQRYVGLIFPADAVRKVFLGTLVLGDEQQALQYGQDETRDIAGYIERIGPSRWRLLMPQPHFESQFDVLELIPTPEYRR